MSCLHSTALVAVLIVGGCTTTPNAPLSPAVLVAGPEIGAALQVEALPLSAPEVAIATGPAITPITAGPQDDRPPETRIREANQAARIQPDSADYDAAAQVYVYSPNSLYQVYAAPERITDIALQPGETLSGEGAIAAGDTARWIIGETVSGSGDQARTHVLIKPTRADLTTNLVLHTDQRTYLIELQARPDVYMASVTWRYPQDEALGLQRVAKAAATRQTEPLIDVDRLNFTYVVSGDRVPWRPTRVFDDGTRVFIEFDPEFDRAALPPLFLKRAETSDPVLANYRVLGRRIVVDRLFDTAELRLVEGRQQRVVRIERRGAAR